MQSRSQDKTLLSRNFGEKIAGLKRTNYRSFLGNWKFNPEIRFATFVSSSEWWWRMRKFHQILSARSSAGEVCGWKVLTLIKIYLIDFLENTRVLPLTKLKHFHLILLSVPQLSSSNLVSLINLIYCQMTIIINLLKSMVPAEIMNILVNANLQSVFERIGKFNWV